MNLLNKSTKNPPSPSPSLWIEESRCRSSELFNIWTSVMNLDLSSIVPPYYRESISIRLYRYYSHSRRLVFDLNRFESIFRTGLFDDDEESWMESWITVEEGGKVRSIIKIKPLPWRQGKWSFEFSTISFARNREVNSSNALKTFDLPEFAQFSLFGAGKCYRF